MSDELNIGGTNYISSKRAADLCGYTQDYVGQLARSGQVEARRVSGLWYISLDSLNAHKEKAESYIPQPPASAAHRSGHENDISVSFDGRTFVTAARAAKVTGYAPDYIGQLAREGKILSRQVGNRWYVDQEGLLAHKNEKDSLLAKVQVQAVGLEKNNALAPEPVREHKEAPLLTYFSSEAVAAMPSTEPDFPKQQEPARDRVEESTVPIRVVERATVDLKAPEPAYHRLVISPVPSGKRVSQKHMRLFGAATGVGALTVLLMLSLYFDVFSRAAVFASKVPSGAGLTAGAAGAVDAIGSLLESFVANDIHYYAE